MRQQALMLALLLACSATHAHMLNMTLVHIDVSPSGEVRAEIEIDLLRSAGSDAAYLTLARAPMAARHAPMWAQLAAAIELHQGATPTSSLRVINVQPPEPFDATAFDDPYRWPRMRVQLLGDGVDPSHPLAVTFTRSFIFEEPIAVTLAHRGAQKSRWLLTGQRSPFVGGTDSTSSSAAADPAWAIMADGIAAGWWHILPEGFDHLLFLAALALAVMGWRRLFVLVSLFTVAHCITLGVAAYRLVAVPAAWVEGAILGSISLYALLALTGRGVGHSGVMVFLVGLLHGLGFASAFADVANTDALLLSLAAFNIGIELAQISFVLMLFAALSAARSRLSDTAFRRGVVRPASVALLLAPVVIFIAG